METSEERELELRIFGETESNVKTAEDRVNKLINMQFNVEENFEDDRIITLTNSQKRILKEAARKLRLTIDIDDALNCIQIKGSKESIADMKVQIMAILNQAEKDASRKAQAQTMMKIVQWKRMDSSETFCC